MKMAMESVGAKLPHPWDAVGRGTEVGRALFALYNGFGEARNYGNRYSDINREKITKSLCTRELDPPPFDPPPVVEPKSKTKVKVPCFRKKHIAISEIPQVLLMRGRRKGNQILTRMKNDFLHRENPPPPKHPLLDEKEKARLQEIFEWSGRDIGEDSDCDENNSSSANEATVQKPPVVKGSIEEQEMLMEAIAKEIQDRKTFLDQMVQLGRGPKYEPIMRLEIQDRVRQMRLLDKNITLMEKKKLEQQESQERNKTATFSDANRESSQIDFGQFSQDDVLDGKEPYNNSTRSLANRANVLTDSNCNKDPKLVDFETQLNAIRRQNKAHKKKKGPSIRSDVSDLSESCRDMETSSTVSYSTALSETKSVSV